MDSGPRSQTFKDTVTSCDTTSQLLETTKRRLKWHALQAVLGSALLWHYQSNAIRRG